MVVQRWRESRSRSINDGNVKPLCCEARKGHRATLVVNWAIIFSGCAGSLECTYVRGDYSLLVIFTVSVSNMFDRGELFCTPFSGEMHNHERATTLSHASVQWQR